ncbi:ATP-grasp domain-containing protein [Parapedobacter soli]|uniref:ATP-grasp domain-containing protein n=1 Tax=Parapedobacter soli TaxID=416955 RepID=UPI0021C83BC6|nr:hypothetical protein [Parapedobacter soli]
MKSIKLAIHHRAGSFSEQWIAYCREKKIPFKIVNCYHSDIIQQLQDCDALMWHHDFTVYQDLLFAKELLFSIQHSGKKVFPDFHSTWHYDDKIGQKYLLESIGAPVIPTYVFYDKKSALTWIRDVTFPKVFKLKGGSGARNVRLVKNQRQARKLVNRCFGRGFSQYNKFGSIKERIRRFREGKAPFYRILTGIGRVFIVPEKARMVGAEKGYAYFQEFIPNNDYDIRLIVIGDKAYGMKRMNRKNDFRASGSANFVYDPIPPRVLKIAFETSEKLKLQSVAFDFVYDEERNPLIVEISYCFGTKGSSKCPGYWDKDLNWYEGQFDPQGWMVENLIKQ